jgi:hypothetical protein
MVRNEEKIRPCRQIERKRQERRFCFFLSLGARELTTDARQILSRTVSRTLAQPDAANGDFTDDVGFSLLDWKHPTVARVTATIHGSIEHSFDVASTTRVHHVDDYFGRVDDWTTLGVDHRRARANI